MPILHITLLMSFAVLACLIWLFESSLPDHLSRWVGLENFQNTKSKMPSFFEELFSCPWCVSFHFSLWLHVIMYPFLGVSFAITTLSIISASGIAMAIYKITFIK